VKGGGTRMKREETQTISKRTKIGERKFLTFSLDREEYGIEILRVREIIGVMDVTYVPGTPDFVRGVINLRGKIIPVIDLKYKFGLGEAEITEKSCIIVVDVNSNGRVIQTGLLVDSVSEVLDVGDEDIEETPSFGDGVRVDFILGMAKVGNRVKILLDVDKVLSTAEILQVASLRSEVEQDCVA